MKFTKYLLLSSLSMLTCSVFADLTQNGINEEVDDEQFRAVRHYIESKRDVSILQKGGKLKIGGDVKVDYTHQHQVLDGQRVEGKGLGGDRNLMGSKEMNLPAQMLNVEASLSFDYRNDKSFANVLIRMANHGGLDTTNFSDVVVLSGTGSGQSRLDAKNNYSPTKNKLDLARAYIGYNLWEDDSYKLVGNVGRQRLYDLFDSRVMFVNRFDGVVFKYTGAFEGVGHAHATAGAFLISDRVNHYGKVAEVGLNHIADSGLGLKYAFIDWSNGQYSDGSNSGFGDDSGNKYVTNNAYQYLNEAFRYAVSQILATYELPSEWTSDYKVKLYGAFLHNHKAHGMRDFYTQHDHDGKNNNAWYAGLTVGRIARPGDWVFDACYQYVRAQAVPDFDSFGGAGRGNLTSVWGVLDRSQGNTNYKGIQAKFAYLLTADLLVKLNAAHSEAADAHLSSINSLARYGRGLQNNATGENTRGARNHWDVADVELVYSF